MEIILCTIRFSFQVDGYMLFVLRKPRDIRTDVQLLDNVADADAKVLPFANSFIQRFEPFRWFLFVAHLAAATKIAHKS